MRRRRRKGWRLLKSNLRMSTWDSLVVLCTVGPACMDYSFVCNCVYRSCFVSRRRVNWSMMMLRILLSSFLVGFLHIYCVYIAFNVLFSNVCPLYTYPLCILWSFYFMGWDIRKLIPLVFRKWSSYDFLSTSCSNKNSIVMKNNPS